MSILKKAITFSYDDGVLYDNHLIEIFNKYNIKATFNICTGSKEAADKGWRTKNGTLVKRNDFSKKENICIYDGHEIAVHTRNHLWLNKIDDEHLNDEILGNKRDLEEMFKRKVIGMAYPFNTYDDRSVKILSDNGFCMPEKDGKRILLNCKVTFCVFVPHVIITIRNFLTLQINFWQWNRIVSRFFTSGDIHMSSRTRTTGAELKNFVKKSVAEMIYFTEQTVRYLSFSKNDKNGWKVI